MLDFFLSLLGTEGERSKFLALYKKHKERLHRVAMRFLHNKAVFTLTAKDGTSETITVYSDSKVI